MTSRKKEKITQKGMDKKLSQDGLSDKIAHFYQRWNINVDQQEIFADFKQRTLDSILTSDEIKVRSIITNKELKKEYLRIIGELPDDENDIWDESLIIPVSYHKNRIFNILQQQQDFVKYLFYLQAVFWLTILTQKEKNALYMRFEDDIAKSQVQVRLVKTEKDVLFYPAGAKLLDDNLINDMLGWVIKYPDVYNNFKNALEEYTKKIYQRNLLDNLRLALELLLKHILNNDKSLENQKQALGQYLKEKAIASEIRNLYMTSIDYYAKYQNNHAKHSDSVNETEVEFILYLTGTFIRFLSITESLP
ncbi:MAG: hypothetical protein BWK80_11300 [Desulfobacteraceae bacterium IS3]|nr:MAG: hypothetical protein BWK80_11300 [Desulfobacteraceae bacterium IS3]